jgi:hypothetical protein
VDGDARGGAALSIRYLTGKPIKFLGVGEKVEALEPFHPERIASRILGMGDILSLIEEAEQSIDKEKTEKIAKKIGERLKFIHVKDGPAQWNDQLAIDNPDPMTAVGKGTMDYSKIIKAANGHPAWLVVEMDKTADEVFKALKESFDYIMKNQWVS